MPRLLILAACAAASIGCYIQGVDSGVCVDPSEVARRAPFCAKSVHYRACVPKEYPWFPNHTLGAKDGWIAGTFDRVKKRRLLIESGAVPVDLQPWEGGGPGTALRFSANLDCETAYRNFLCYMNFPRCDAQDESMMLCRSVCINYFRACRYATDMIRCFAVENQGGATPESTTTIDPETGLPILSRAPYPGQPFRDNVFANGVEQPVCTPAGGAGATVLASWAAALSVVAITVLALR